MSNVILFKNWKSKVEMNSQFMSLFQLLKDRNFSGLNFMNIVSKIYYPEPKEFLTYVETQYESFLEYTVCYCSGLFEIEDVKTQEMLYHKAYNEVLELPQDIELYDFYKIIYKRLKKGVKKARKAEEKEAFKI